MILVLRKLTVRVLINYKNKRYIISDRCLEMKKVKQTGLVIQVACILHNLCINLRDNPPNEEVALELEMIDDPGNGDLNGRNKRDMLADM